MLYERQQQLSLDPDHPAHSGNVRQRILFERFFGVRLAHPRRARLLHVQERNALRTLLQSGLRPRQRLKSRTVSSVFRKEALPRCGRASLFSSYDPRMIEKIREHGDDRLAVADAALPHEFIRPRKRHPAHVEKFPFVEFPRAFFRVLGFKDV